MFLRKSCYSVSSISSVKLDLNTQTQYISFIFFIFFFFREAAEHLITALNQQARGKDVLNSGRKSQMSETIWSTLRMCISLSNQSELKSLVDEQDLPGLNKAFGID